MTQNQLPPCPMCGHNRHSVPHGKEEYFCRKHGMAYDGRDDGVVYTDPTKRLRQEENYKGKRR